MERSASGYASSESWGLVMAGGYNERDQSTVQTTFNGEAFGSLPNLPETKDRTCLVVIDDDRLFNCGGNPYPTDSETLIFSKSTNSWSR